MAESLVGIHMQFFLYVGKTVDFLKYYFNVFVSLVYEFINWSEVSSADVTIIREWCTFWLIKRWRFCWNQTNGML